LAAARRAEDERRRAAPRACRDSDFFDAALRPWPLSARRTARLRRGDGLRRRVERRLADRALRFVPSDADAGGCGSLTPARRAFDRPIAIACFVEAAPCLPSRT
jgi:hypothetical protein